MIRTDKRLRLCRTLLICVLAFIWGNSLMPGAVSGAISDWVGKILALIFESTGEETPSGFPLRKLAHFTEFAALGMLLAWRFAMLGKGKVRPFLWGSAAACIDETIQIFVPDRGPGVKDVLIDCGGVLTGMILLYFGHTIFVRNKHNHSLEDTK